MSATAYDIYQDLMALPESKLAEVKQFVEFKKQSVQNETMSSQKMNQAQWQHFIQETSGTWEDMPLAEEIREGWDYFTEREPC